MLLKNLVILSCSLVSFASALSIGNAIDTLADTVDGAVNTLTGKPVDATLTSADIESTGKLVGASPQCTMVESELLELVEMQNEELRNQDIANIRERFKKYNDSGMRIIEAPHQYQTRYMPSRLKQQKMCKELYEARLTNYRLKSGENKYWVYPSKGSKVDEFGNPDDSRNASQSVFYRN